MNLIDWQSIVKLDKQIDAIQADPLFHTRMTEYNEKVDAWILLAEKIGTDAEGVKDHRGFPSIVKEQGLLF